MSVSLADLFRRDLSRLIQQIEAFPSDEMLWQKLAGITNPAGNLVLHIEGNLREFVGRQLGNLPYDRDRPLEFSAEGASRAELVSRIGQARDLVTSVIGSLSPQQLEMEFPEVVLERALSTQAFLISLYGHLNWHLGQIDYLRRILSGGAAIRAVGL